MVFEDLSNHLKVGIKRHHVVVRLRPGELPRLHDLFGEKWKQKELEEPLGNLGHVRLKLTEALQKLVDPADKVVLLEDTSELIKPLWQVGFQFIFSQLKETFEGFTNQQAARMSTCICYTSLAQTLNLGEIRPFESYLFFCTFGSLKFELLFTLNVRAERVQQGLGLIIGDCSPRLSALAFRVVWGLAIPLRLALRQVVLFQSLALTLDVGSLSGVS